MDLPKRESCVTLGSLSLPIRAKFVVPGFSRNFRLQAVLRGGTVKRYYELFFPAPQPANRSAKNSVNWSLAIASLACAIKRW